jgi:hypothetical protein
MDESNRTHLDTAAQEWEHEETRAKRWTLMLRVLPWLVVGLLMLVVFSVFG